MSSQTAALFVGSEELIDSLFARIGTMLVKAVPVAMATAG